MWTENEKVHLHWNSPFYTAKSTYHETYTIDISTDDGKNWVPYIDGLQELSFTTETLEYGVPYRFRVKTQNRNGYSESTNFVKYFRGISSQSVLTMTAPL